MLLPFSVCFAAAAYAADIVDAAATTAAAFVPSCLHVILHFPFSSSSARGLSCMIFGKLK